MWKNFSWNEAKIYKFKKDTKIIHEPKIINDGHIQASILDDSNLVVFNSVNFENLESGLESNISSPPTINHQINNTYFNLHDFFDKVSSNYSLFEHYLSSYSNESCNSLTFCASIILIIIFSFGFVIFGIFMLKGKFNIYVCNDDYGNCQYHKVNSVITNTTLLKQYYDFNENKYECYYNEILKYDNFYCNKNTTEYIYNSYDCEYFTKTIIGSNMEVYIQLNETLTECKFTDVKKNRVGIDTSCFGYILVSFALCIGYCFFLIFAVILLPIILYPIAFISTIYKVIVDRYNT